MRIAILTQELRPRLCPRCLSVLAPVQAPHRVRRPHLERAVVACPVCEAAYPAYQRPGRVPAHVLVTGGARA